MKHRQKKKKNQLLNQLQNFDCGKKKKVWHIYQFKYDSLTTWKQKECDRKFSKYFKTHEKQCQSNRFSIRKQMNKCNMRMLYLNVMGTFRNPFSKGNRKLEIFPNPEFPRDSYD